jgi:RNA polymerase sigma factor (sigma-70 family)
LSPRFSIRPLSAQSDARLAEFAAGGEERAFETLARRHRRALARYCARIGVPEHRVDDVLQHSLTKAWLSLSEGMEVREPRAWLYRIVHNASINSIRSARRHAHDPLESLPLALVPSTGEEPGLALRARDALGHVAALPEMQRDAIVMTAIEGRSHEETAGLLGVSDGAVRGLVHRARTTLRSAAAALSPQGLLGLLARLGGGDAPLAERSAEISAGGAAVGATGLFAKGAVVTALAGLLAAGGSITHLGAGPDHGGHTRSPAASQAVSASSSGGAAGGQAFLPTSSDSGLGKRSSGRKGSDRRGASHERGGRHGGERPGGRGEDGGRSSGRDDVHGVAGLGAAGPPVTSDVDRPSDGDHAGGRDGRKSGSGGGSGASASSGSDGGSSSQGSTEADNASADAGQVSDEAGSSGGGGGSSGGASVSGGQDDAVSGGSSGGSGKADSEADGSGRGPQASRISG